MFDVIIVGKGPAGISAALYTARANLKTLIIGRNESSILKAEKIENYYGFAEPISGRYLLEEGEKQVRRLGVEIIDDDVISMDNLEHFKVSTSNAAYESKAVLLATGVKQVKINVKGLESFEGKGVSYCSTCDGFFYRNMKVGILGYKDYAIHEAIELQAFTKNITIFTNGMELVVSDVFKEQAKNFGVNNKRLVALEGDEFLTDIKLEDGSSESIDGLFVAFGSASSTDFARKLGVMLEGNAITVDKNQQTNLDGLFAAGDCTGGFKQISVAVGQGANAGRHIIEYVRKK